MSTSQKYCERHFVLTINGQCSVSTNGRCRLTFRYALGPRLSVVSLLFSTPKSSQASLPLCTIQSLAPDFDRACRRHRLFPRKALGGHATTVPADDGSKTSWLAGPRRPIPITKTSSRFRSIGAHGSYFANAPFANPSLRHIIGVGSSQYSNIPYISTVTS